MWAADLPRRPPSEHFILHAYQCAKFQHPSSISFQDKEGMPKFNVGLRAPCRTPYAETVVCGRSTWQGQTACQISTSYLYASCSYAYMYLHRLTIITNPKMSFWGGVEDEDVKIVCSNPQKSLLCVNTRLLVHRFL